MRGACQRKVVVFQILYPVGEGDVIVMLHIDELIAWNNSFRPPRRRFGILRTFDPGQVKSFAEILPRPE